MHITARSLLRCVIAGVVAPAILTSLTYPQVIRLNADTTGSQNETTISLNLQNPANLVAGSNYIGQWVAAYSTFNAGASWSGTLLPKGSYDRAVDPSVAIDRQGNAWFAHLCLDLLPENHPANGIFVNRSTDGGVTWLAEPYVVTENGDPEGSEGTTIRVDRPGIACDRVPNSPFVNSVYVTWIRGTADSSDNQVYFSWRDPELLEFSTPVKISDSPTGLAQAPAVAVGAGGRVLVAWYDRNVQKILLDVSTDGGRTFGEDRVLASNVADGVVVWGARALTYPSMATNALGGRYNGNVYVAWHENRSGHNRVMFRRSTNNGDSWGEAFPLEEDLTSHRWFPWVTTAPNGVVHAVY